MWGALAARDTMAVDLPTSIQRFSTKTPGSGVILITGASGRVARRTAELLAGDGQRLRLMTRNPQRAPKLTDAETVRGDFAEPATLKDAFTGVSAALVVSASGEPGERARLHRNAFQAAARAGVGHVVYLSLQGAAPDSKYPFSRDHYLSEQYLFAAGLPCTVLRNAFYIDMFLETKPTVPACSTALVPHLRTHPHIEAAGPPAWTAVWQCRQR